MGESQASWTLYNSQILVSKVSAGRWVRHPIKVPLLGLGFHCSKGEDTPPH